MNLDTPTLYVTVSLYALLGALVVALLLRRLPSEVPGLLRTAVALAGLALCALPIGFTLMGGADLARRNAAFAALVFVAKVGVIEGMLDFLGIAYSRRGLRIFGIVVTATLLAFAAVGQSPRFRIALYSGATAILAAYGFRVIRRAALRGPNLGRSILCWTLSLLAPFALVRSLWAMLTPDFDALNGSALNSVGLVVFDLFLIGVVFSCVLMVSDLLVLRERAANAELVRERERLAATVDLLEEARSSALSASREKTKFLAMTSHEIRTPLYGVLGLADLLGDTRLDAEQTDYLRRMKLNGEHLLSLITSVLDLAKIEEGRVEVGRSAFDLRALVEQVHEELRALADSKGLALSWQVAPNVPGWVLGDRVKIAQVLTNLVGNAIKFTQRGSVRTFVECESREGESLRFRILDTGPGLPAAEKRALFRPFERPAVSGDRTPAPPGIGLGLAISRALVEAMGGEIGVEERLSAGAAFWFTLPLARAGTPTEPFLPPKGAFAAQRLSGGRALVVEDDETSALILRHWLSTLSMSVTVASDGAQGFELARSGDYLLVVLDRQLPTLDGIEVGRRIRAWERASGSRRSVLILCTAHALREVAEEARAADFDEVVTKPFDRSVFENLLSSLEVDAVASG